MTAQVALVLASLASIAICIRCARLACRRFFATTTKKCWLGNVQTTIAIFVAALVVGIYLRFEQHPPIVLALVLVPYAAALFTLVAAVVWAAIRSGVMVSTDKAAAAALLLIATTILVVASLATGYVVGEVIPTAVN